MVVLKSFEFHCLTHTHTLCVCFIAATSLIESHNRIFIYSHIHMTTVQRTNTLKSHKTFNAKRSTVYEAISFIFVHVRCYLFFGVCVASFCIRNNISSYSFSAVVVSVSMCIHFESAMRPKYFVHSPFVFETIRRNTL